MARVSRKDLLLQDVGLPKFSALPEPNANDYVDIGSEYSSGHPFIEVIGKIILSIPDFTKECVAKLPLPSSYKKKQDNPVLVALSLAYLNRVVFPTPNLIRLFQRVVEVITIGYLDRHPLKNKEQAKVVHLLTTMPVDKLAKHVMEMNCTNAPSLLVIGASGMGKTFGIEYVLSLLPQVYRHRNYRGAVMNHVQVLYLTVECPPTGTLKALLLEILLRLDIVLGTQFYTKWLFSNVSNDLLLVNVALILYNHSVGALVLDELQHLKVRGYRDTEMLLNFFVSLMNFLKIPIISVGTYAAKNFLTQAMRDARRLCSSGTLDFSRYSFDDPTTHAMQGYYLSHLPGLKNRPITDEFHRKIYHIYQGFHFLLPNLVYRCSVEANYRGLDYVTDEVLDYYTRVELKPINDALEALRAMDADRIELWDDLMSPEDIEELRHHQGGIDEKRERSQGDRRGRGKESVVSGLDFVTKEFPHEQFSEKEIQQHCVRAKIKFGEGDLYPILEQAGLLAKNIKLGDYLA